jgi:hypothetical protein
MRHQELAIQELHQQTLINKEDKSMKATNKTDTTDKTSKDIRNNALFTDMTAQEEVFVRGGVGIPERLSKGVSC